MHRIFEIRELTDIICRCLKDDVNLRSLARFARTWKTLEEPSLDMLWSHLDSLVPLLLVMSNIRFSPLGRPHMSLTFMLRLFVEF
ncbi:hypothetical protein C8Q75DRAFT_772562 [Abortiporus biennis]|nr:hypothetical protein C8Q75DRAFT_772562 [Abortiporus biennis]